MDCGSCKHFIKVKSIQRYGRDNNDSLCELFDGLTQTDDGHKCKGYKRVKFHRRLEASKQEDVLVEEGENLE